MALEAIEDISGAHTAMFPTRQRALGVFYYVLKKGGTRIKNRI